MEDDQRRRALVATERFDGQPRRQRAGNGSEKSQRHLRGHGRRLFNIDGSINGRRGAGIFKTTDGGATWTRLQSTSAEDFYYVNDLVISPTNSQRLYAATGTGVFRSLDGGASWTHILNPTK
ncbi:MAG: hypothetical protein HY269_05305 [Deltaproteobacteria bacterium]|nr:hypothetical protein [Deltaproteobacteria bacterium]